MIFINAIKYEGSRGAACNLARIPEGQLDLRVLVKSVKETLTESVFLLFDASPKNDQSSAITAP